MNREKLPAWLRCADLRDACRRAVQITAQIAEGGGRGFHAIARVWLVSSLMVAVWGLECRANEGLVRRLSYAEVANQVQLRMVKVFGTGGLRGLESYQSGFLISPQGHVLTAWSYVLDSGDATVILDDGRKFTSEIVGADPGLELAILKIDAEDLPYFPLDQSVSLRTGARVLAFSNLYGVATGNEATSVLHGVVSAVTKLSARRGTFETPYRGPVYVLDAMTNNAGAAGGALTDSRGRLAGVLGKELRDADANTWLNYALPVAEIQASVTAILEGNAVDSTEAQRLPDESANLDDMGIVLIPNVLRNTPPFVDMVLPNSPAHRAGLRADDLIVLVNGQAVASQASLTEKLLEIDVVDPVRLIVTRNTELVEFEIQTR